MDSPQHIILSTGDGSDTILIREGGLTYHSNRGAIQESQHVFIRAGLHAMQERLPAGEPLSILEMGFGTGLNAFLTAIETLSQNQQVHYTALEAYPLEAALVAGLNYPLQLRHEDLFAAIHTAGWGRSVAIHKTFSLRKLEVDLLHWTPDLRPHLIYFDAFAPDAQPHLWTEDVFRKLATAMHDGGILVTYCSKGSVRRAMEAAGWTVEKIPGPPGKREMVRARKKLIPIRISEFGFWNG